jgi:peptidase E
MTAPARHIVALGGGGFLMEPENPLLDDFVLSLAGKKKPRVCFVPTALGDSAFATARFYAAFGDGRSDPCHLPLFARDRESVRDRLLRQDVVYVGGGNTANMLALWRLHRVDAALREAWEAGVVLAGVSAGGLCWFECGTTDSFSPDLTPLADGLGFLAGSFSPHYDGEPRRRPLYRELVASGFSPGFAADDGAALHFVGTELRECVASRPNARAYRVERGSGGAAETELPTRFLG